MTCQKSLIHYLILVRKETCSSTIVAVGVNVDVLQLSRLGSVPRLAHTACSCAAAAAGDLNVIL
jgi:hypothetical protein